MKILFAHDHHYIARDDGSVLSHGQFGRKAWDRYLDAFDEMTIIGRAGHLKAGEDETRLNRADAPRVSFSLFPDTNNLKGLVGGRGPIEAQVDALVQQADAVILRGMSELGWMVYRAARRLNKPIAFEVISHSFDDLWHHGTLAARAYAFVRHARARVAAQKASHVLYVTEKKLQGVYPPGKQAVTLAASNVDVKVEVPKTLQPAAPFSIGLIGALSNNLKGIDVAIDALATVRADVVLRILGPGDPSRFMARISANALEGRVVFDGILPSGAPVVQWLRQLDLYIQPSRQEGLPRAVIEAMAQGLPVIGANAGGMAELLAPEWVVKRGSAKELAAAMTAMLASPALMQKTGARNFETAQKYDANVLEARRRTFWADFAAFAARRA